MSCVHAMCIQLCYPYRHVVHAKRCVCFTKVYSPETTCTSPQEALQLKGFLTVSSEGEEEDADKPSHRMALASIGTCAANSRGVIVSNDGTRLVVHDMKQVMNADVKHHAIHDFMCAR